MDGIMFALACFNEEIFLVAQHSRSKDQISFYFYIFQRSKVKEALIKKQHTILQLC